jgi:CHAT domain-containing protein
LLVFLPLKDSSPLNPQADYNRAQQALLQGYPAVSQQDAERGFNLYSHSNPELAARFQLLEADAMEWRGMYEDAERVLAMPSPGRVPPGAAIQKLSIDAVALIHLQQFSPANSRLQEAESLCGRGTEPVCGEVTRARGLLAMEQGRFSDARTFFLMSLESARANSDRRLEATSLLNLGAAMLQQEHFDEALDWSKSALQASLASGDENLNEAALGNLGWAYFGLGDTDRALELFLDAERRATEIGNVRNQLKWLSTAGNAYLVSRDLTRATQSYRLAIDLAKRINSKQDIVNSLEDLAHISIAAGDLDGADSYLAQLAPLVAATASRLDDLDVMLAQGKLAAARRQDQQARDIFRAVEKDPDSQTSMRLGAEHELARLFESEHDIDEADDMYRTALTTFESARSDLKEEESKLPFLTNATPIYDDYIHFLIQQGKSNLALAVADQSRARTLAQGLGLAAAKPFKPAPLRPSEVARKARATLLFYWLGEQRSYLWAITPRETALFPLPPQGQIVPVVERYRNAILGPVDPVDAGNEDGRALYNMLVAPAADLIPTDAPVMVLDDGALSRLNFETLLAAGNSPLNAPDAPDPPVHYWIDDVTLITAPSLSMLMAAKAPPTTGGKLLLLGDAVSPGQDYPELRMAAREMSQIQRHFAVGDETVFERQRANPAAYLTSNPSQFAFIHFVTHGVASRTDPLDSAIILSRSGDAEDSFKLHAREIIQHPIDARLVTISACYGSGERSYAGEGMVGLSWAFLRAGAHNVIGALWEASDESTPVLMDKLYDGLGEGLEPGDALHRAKLALLHSDGKFKRPYFWAPFQIYSGH